LRQGHTFMRFRQVSIEASACIFAAKRMQEAVVLSLCGVGGLPANADTAAMATTQSEMKVFMVFFFSKQVTLSR
jgi:hypothetical protein